MKSDWKRRFTWVDAGEMESVFLGTPFPERGHRGNLAPLRESIARFGVINPIIARVRYGKLQVICGYRRLLAAQVAGTERIPVVIARLTDAEALRLFAEESPEKWGGEKGAPGSRHEIPYPVAGLSETVAGGVGQKPLATVAGTGESEDESESIELDVEETYRRTVAIFERINAETVLPRREVESLLESIQDLQPIRKGFDIREVGGESENCDSVIPWLSAHSLRVAFLAHYFSESRGLCSDSVASLTAGGLLHDVGMLLIPEREFQSAYPLTRSGERILRRHTHIGGQLLASNREWPETVVLTAREHHERWDGTGYPAGKRGDEIHPAARMIGILDAYAAMISKRVYRPSYLIGEAIRIVRESAALGLFDPALAEDFLEVFSCRPVGLWGRLPDGSLARVARIRRGDANSHQLEIEKGGSRYHAGETLWFQEDRIERELTEIPIPARAALKIAADRDGPSRG